MNLVKSIKNDFLEKRIKPIFPEATIDDIVFNEYLGMYNGNFITIISYKKDIDETNKIKIEIEKLIFNITKGNNLFVWKNGGFKLLREVYNNKTISLEELKEIHYFHINKNLQPKLV